MTGLAGLRDVVGHLDAHWTSKLANYSGLWGLVWGCITTLTYYKSVSIQAGRGGFRSSCLEA